MSEKVQWDSNTDFVSESEKEPKDCRWHAKRTQQPAQKGFHWQNLENLNIEKNNYGNRF